MNRIEEQKGISRKELTEYWIGIGNGRRRRGMTRHRRIQQIFSHDKGANFGAEELQGI